VDIGKEIARYDALDTGMFLCSPSLFGRLEAAQRMETVRSPMACGNWPASAAACMESARLNGKTWIPLKHWRTPKEYSMGSSITNGM